MRIAFLCESLSFGGIERVVSVLADSFAKEGNDVTIITTVNDQCSFALNADISRCMLKFDSNTNLGVKIGQKLCSLRKIFKEKEIDICYAFGYKSNCFAIIAASGLKNRVIISERTDPDAYATPVTRKMRDFLYRYASMLVCQTKYVQDYYALRGVKRSVVIPNPVKQNLAEPFNGQRRQVVVNFCRLNKQKNIPVLISAFEQFSRLHPDWKMELYGEGQEKENIQRMITDKGLEKSIHIFDFVLDIHERIVDAGMFVSSSDYEGISNSMLEAMAIGLPTICTDCPVGGAKMTIEDGKNGLLTPVRDAVALAEAMSRIADDPVFAEELGNAAVKVRDRFSIDLIVKQWKDMSCKIL